MSVGGLLMLGEARQVILRAMQSSPSNNHRRVVRNLPFIAGWCEISYKIFEIRRKNSSSRERGGILGDFKIVNDSFVINQISQHLRSHFWHKGAHDAVLFLV